MAKAKKIEKSAPIAEAKPVKKKNRPISSPLCETTIRVRKEDCLRDASGTLLVPVACMKSAIKKDHGYSALTRFNVNLSRGGYNSVRILGEVFLKVSEPLNVASPLSVLIYAEVV